MSLKSEKIEAQRMAFNHQPTQPWHRHLVGPVELEGLLDKDQIGDHSERMRKAVGRLNEWRTKWAISSQDLADIQDEFFILACKLTGEPSNGKPSQPAPTT